MTKLIETKPTTYEKASKHQEWKNEMLEEYNYRMDNDVCKLFLDLKTNHL